MFVLGALILVGVFVGGQLAGADPNSPQILVPALIGGWLCFAPIRRALFGKRDDE